MPLFTTPRYTDFNDLMEDYSRILIDNRVERFDPRNPPTCSRCGEHLDQYQCKNELCPNSNSNLSGLEERLLANFLETTDAPFLYSGDLSNARSSRQFTVDTSSTIWRDIH